MLKENKTLATLVINGGLQCITQITIYVIFPENNDITANGTKEICEGLKTNSTLNQLRFAIKLIVWNA